MGHSIAVMVVSRKQKNLSLMHESSKRLRMNYFISVTLKLCTVYTGRVGILSSSRICCQKSILGQGLFFALEKNVADLLSHNKLRIQQTTVFFTFTTIIYTKIQKNTRIILNFFKKNRKKKKEGKYLPFRRKYIDY
jgi:hypothetical protein